MTTPHIIGVCGTVRPNLGLRLIAILALGLSACSDAQPDLALTKLTAGLSLDDKVGEGSCSAAGSSPPCGQTVPMLLPVRGGDRNDISMICSLADVTPRMVAAFAMEAQQRHEFIQLPPLAGSRVRVSIGEVAGTLTLIWAQSANRHGVTHRGALAAGCAMPS